MPLPLDVRSYCWGTGRKGNATHRAQNAITKSLQPIGGSMQDNSELHLSIP
jgi:hypothetical protein